LQDMWPTVRASWNLKSQKSFSTLRRTISTFQAHCWNGPLFFLQSKHTKTHKNTQTKKQTIKLIKLIVTTSSSSFFVVLTSYGLLLDPGAHLTWTSLNFRTQQDSTQLKHSTPKAQATRELVSSAITHQVKTVSRPHALLKEYSPPSVTG
jgi:hypothetical protein